MLTVPQVLVKVRKHIHSLIDVLMHVLHRNNKIVQKHLYDRMDDLLQLNVAVPDMAEVLTEVCELIYND